MPPPYVLNGAKDCSFVDFAEKTKADILDALKIRISGRSDGDVLRRMLSDGKKLRPLLCVLSFWVCGGTEKDYPRALDVSAAVELGHSASLCHDDIVDRDLRRRGRQAMWVEDGIPEALIAGHRAVSLGFVISLSHGTEIAQTFLKAWDMALRGGEMEADARKNGKIDSAEYFEIIENKTASLFAAATKAGSQIAGAPVELQNAIEEYGKAVGVTYQIADDLSEIDEVKAGELSSVVGWYGNVKAPIRDILEKQVTSYVERAEMLARDERIPESFYKQYLMEIPRYCVSQIVEEAMRLPD